MADAPGEPPPASEPEADSQDDDLRRLLDMGARPPPLALTEGQRVGERFRIVRRLAAGGMGVVYLATDVDLDRPVAIKFPSTEPGERLRREAALIARLIHPNVVVVYEVGTWNQRPYVAMEYVAGGTFRAWLDAAARTPREIVERYVEAGRGLAAAHAAGLVHRDFKPDNVLVADDGRVRVADFGLASDDQGLASGGGTPGYMAPEQRAGRAVGAAADQFAFAVALREALAPHPRVARHVVRALERAVAPEPDDRFPSMDALLRELARDPAARRRRVLTVAAITGTVAGLTAAVVWFAVAGHARAPACGVARAGLAGIWDAVRRAEVDAAFRRSGRVDADAAFTRAAAALDARADAWIAMRIDACEATHVRGEQSPSLLDLRMRCLDQRRDELHALVGVLATSDVDTVDHAVAAVAALPALDGCTDARALTAAVPMPIDLARRVAIVAGEAHLADLLAAAGAGRFAATLPAADALIAEPAVTSYAPLAARVALGRADLLHAMGRASDAEPAYYDAARWASEARDDAIAAAAWRGVIELRGETGRVAGAEPLVAAATAAVARFPTDSYPRAALARALAELTRRQGLFAAMQAQAAAAHAWFAAHRAGSLDEAAAATTLATAEQNSGHLDRALELAGRALAIYQALLGGDHPTVAEAHRRHAQLLAVLGRFDDAAAELAALAPALERAYGAASPAAIRLDQTLAEVAFRRGDYAASLELARHAHAGSEPHHDDLLMAQSLIMAARAELGLGRLDTATATLASAQQLAERLQPANEQLLLGIHLLSGHVRMAATDPEGARGHAERARELAVRLFGPESAEVGQAENLLGTSAGTALDHAAAIAHYQRAIAIGLAQERPAVVDVLYARNNLASELAALGRWTEVVDQLAIVVPGLEAQLGPEHPALCPALAGLAFADAMTGHGADGVAAATRGLAIRTKRGELDDPYLQLALGAARWEVGDDRRAARRQVATAAARFHAWEHDPTWTPIADEWLRRHR